ncbi:MAG: hypothetical protein ACRDLB_15125 [Actinomycetota bacterium]
MRIAPRWTSWSFYALGALMVAGVVAASLIRIDLHATGTTAVDHRGRQVVLVPAALAPEVARGNPVELGGGGDGEIVSSDGIVRYPSDVRDLYGVDVTVPTIAILVSSPGEPTSGLAARVLVESEPAILALIPGLESLFGGSDGA